MKQPESYWTYQAGPIPEVSDLPAECFAGGKYEWTQLSPGMRREIYRSAVRQQAEKERRAYTDLVLSTYADFEHSDKRERKQRAAEVNAKAREQL